MPPRKDTASPDLTAHVGSLRLSNPVLAASGTFGYGLEFESLLDLNRLGGFVTKGLSLRPREGNPPPRIHETACGMLNSIGLHNVGVEAFLREKLPRLKRYRTAVIANVYGETPEEFVEVARILGREDGLAALEINVSCPNVCRGGLDLGTDPAQVRALIGRIRAVTEKPIWAKLTPNVTNIVEMARAAAEGGADALCLINSVRGMAVDLDGRRPHLARVYGGLSGPAIKPIALAKVHEVALSMRTPVVGIGGIATGRDALEFLAAGACAVQVGTWNFVRADAATSVIDGIEAYLRGHGIARACDVVRSLSTFAEES